MVNLSPEERELREQIKQKRVAQSAVTGCVVGGLVGAATGWVTGRRPQDIAVGAGVGCLAGGVVGAAAGAYVDSRAQSYADTQTRLTRMAQAAREDVAQYQRTNEITRRLIAKEKEKISALKRKIASGQADRKELDTANERNKKTIELLTKERQTVEDIIATMDRDTNELRNQGANVSALSAERAALVIQGRDLSKSIEALNSLQTT